MGGVWQGTRMSSSQLHPIWGLREVVLKYIAVLLHKFRQVGELVIALINIIAEEVLHHCNSACSPA